MELMYPWVLYIGVPVLLIVALVKRRKKQVFKEGKKVANIDFIEKTELYQKLKRQYRMFSGLSLFCLFFAVVCGFLLLSRPAKVEQVNTELRNRDIFLCMDISSSVDELNIEMCEELKEVVKKLDGERFGISIFNAKSVLLVPLTNDYEYVLDTLDQLLASFEASLGYENGSGDLNYGLYAYKYEGTLSEEGSSYIGDGLASCLYNFPDLTENKERSRIIIFTTDNELNGTPHVSVTEAASLCKKNDVKVFAVAPENVVDEDSFRSDMERTGGKYYISTSSNTFDDLIDEIEKTDTSAMNKVETIVYDKPELVFIGMVVFLSLYFVLNRRIKG